MNHKTISEYSAALQGTLKLGLKQGLAKGLAIEVRSFEVSSVRMLEL